MEDKKIIELLTSILMIPVSVALSAWVFMNIFNWFIVPLYPVIIPVTFKASAGIAVFLAFFKSDSKKKDDESFLKFAINEWVKMLLMLIIAYLIHLVIS